MVLNGRGNVRPQAELVRGRYVKRAGGYIILYLLVEPLQQYSNGILLQMFQSSYILSLHGTVVPFEPST